MLFMFIFLLCLIFLSGGECTLLQLSYFFLMCIILFKPVDLIFSFNVRFVIHYTFLQLKSLFLLCLIFFLKCINVLHLSFKLKWKPLFKKSSYFGIYRSTKNQFLNK